MGVDDHREFLARICCDHVCVAHDLGDQCRMLTLALDLSLTCLALVIPDLVAGCADLYDKATNFAGLADLVGDLQRLPTCRRNQTVTPGAGCGALLALGGFVLFTGTLVAIGTVMPTAKDAGSWFSALIVLMIVPLDSLSLVLSDPNSPVVQLFTYFPYSAPITAMLRNAFGSLAGWEAAIVITELFLLSAIVLQLAVRLFRYGSVEYTD